MYIAYLTVTPGESFICVDDLISVAVGKTLKVTHVFQMLKRWNFTHVVCILFDTSRTATVR